MRLERAQRCEQLFAELLPLDPARRSARLAQEDPDLRGEVQSLLDHHDAAGMLDGPAPFSFGGVEVRVSDDDAALPPQREAGGYALRSVLGSGGMGVVYVAQQVSTRRTVAVKVIRRGAVASSMARRFEHEAAILAKLHHPGIAQIFEAGVADFGHGPQPFIAMELVDGLPLTDFADRQSLDSRARLELVARVCDAVHHAHQRGVIHRDLKPANILVVPSSELASKAGAIGQPKILDFGVARASDAELQVTTLRTGVGQIIGTLPYMSPEQVSGESSDIDVRSDVYALGVLLYRLLVGRLPYDVATRSIAEAARIIRDEPPARLSAIDRTLRGDVESIVSKALEKDKEQRYATAADLAADIRRFLNDEPIFARAATTMYQVRKFVRRNKALTTLLAALVVAFIATIVFGINAIVAGKEAKRAQQTAESESKEAGRQADIARRKAYLANLAAASAATSAHDIVAARRYLDAVDESDKANWEWRHLDAAQDDASVVLLAPGSAVYCVHFSPDGETLAAASFDGVLRLWDLSTNSVVAELRGHERAAYAVAFSPDGTLLASAGADRTVRVWDVASRSERFTLRGHEGVVHSIAFSPKGDLLASSSDDRTIRLWDPIAGVARDELTKRAASPMRGVTFSPDGTRIAAACDDRVVRVWHVGDDEPSATLVGHTGIVYVVAFSPSGQLLASGSQDETVRVWDTKTSQPRTAFYGSGGRIVSITFSRDGSRLVTGSHDMVLRIWSSVTGLALGALTGHVGEVRSVAWSRDGRRFASASSDVKGSIRIWDPADAEGPVQLRGHLGGVLGLAFSPENDILTSLSSDRGVRQWDAASGESLVDLRFEASGPSSSRSRMNGTWLAFLTSAGAIRMLDTTTWIEREPLVNAHAGNLQATLALRADGALLALGDDAGTIHLIDAKSGHEARALTGHAGRVNCMAFSADGAQLASLDAEGTVRLWDPATGALVRTMSDLRDESGNDVEATKRATLLVFSPDGALLGCGGYDERAFLWDTHTGRALPPLDGHAGGARSIAFAPGGDRLATGSGEGVIRIWDPKTSQEILLLRRLVSSVNALLFSSDGMMLAVGTEDRTVRILRTLPAAVAAKARDELRAASAHATVHLEGTNEEQVRALLAQPNRTALERRAALYARHWELVKPKPRAPRGDGPGKPTGE